MMKNVIKHKLPSTHEEWLRNRLKGIGGSDAGSILGFNPYKSAYTLWCEKTGRIHNDADNEAMRIGRDLEDYVAQRFMEATGKKVRKSGYSYQSKEHPFMLANVDRLIVGEDAGLECKTTNLLTKTRYDKGDIPASYYAQCMHYMTVTGLKKWYIAVLILGKGFYWFEVNYDEQEAQALIEAEENFWQCVESDTEPCIDGTDSTSDTLGQLYPGDTESAVIDLFGRNTEIEIYLQLKDQIKDLEKKKKEYENIFKKDLGDAQSGTIEGYQINWKNQKQERFDSKRFKEDHPELYEQYIKEIKFRKFEVKEVK